MLCDRPRLHVSVGGVDVSERAEKITFSATDTGGYEIATLGLPADEHLGAGAPIVIRHGLEVAWQGRVAERSSHNQHNQASKTLGGEGLRALLRDTDLSMIYCDRDLSRWGDPAFSRQLTLVNGHYQLSSSQPAADPATLLPALVQQIHDSWASPYLPRNEAWYDAGQGNLIAQIYYSLALDEAPTTFASWSEYPALRSDVNATTSQVSPDLHSSAPVAGYFKPGVPMRYATVDHFNNASPDGTQGATYNAYWQNLALYGNHGLSGRGADPVGFYPSDIVAHALSQCSGVSSGVIQTASGYIAPHVVYRTPTPIDQIVDDMAKLMGWSWGVWEPATIFSSTPRLDFRAPPTDATAVISRAECDQLDITARLGDLYDVCQVSYSDAAGVAGIATVTLANPMLQEAGLGSRTLQLDMGLASPAAAATFGYYALALSQVAARAAGSVTLPTSVRLIGGGSKPACLLRPGIDRLRITDLPDSGNLFTLGTDRRDVFRVSRVESTPGSDGSISTVAELDNGANLLETLQARLALAASVVGSGAS